MTEDFLVFGQKNWAGLRTYFFDKEHKLYDSRSHLNCRTQNSSLVNFMKNDIYDERIAYFVIKSGVFKISISEIEKPRIMKSYEHFSPECVYAGHGTDFAITDFR
jgi:hypothetical protein